MYISEEDNVIHKLIRKKQKILFRICFQHKFVCYVESFYIHIFIYLLYLYIDQRHCMRCTFNCPIWYSVSLEQCDLFVFQVHIQYILGIHHDPSHLPSVLYLQALYKKKINYLYFQFFISLCI